MGELKNKRHELFCQSFCISLNGTQAAKAAGFAEASANITACKLLKRDDIQVRIGELRAETISQLGIDRNYVLKRHIDIDLLNFADIFDNDNNLLPVQQWPDAWQQSADYILVQEKRDKNGNIISTIKKVSRPNVLNNLKLLGMHTDVGAYSTKIENNETKKYDFSTFSDEEVKREFERVIERINDELGTNYKNG